MTKRYRLPKDGHVEPDQDGGPGFIDGEDVEGHGLPTTAPPSLLPNRGPGHGGEAVPDGTTDEDDVEGHRIS
ncbi:MAG TPA: hypothetical protein VFI69_06375 [Candidatus Limnocylindrales bacterium]|jgi:hypothetical protein|nr:hypothetical protein [Candidatus Limnocylindrales bacterium]